jgi:hypothetical protein
MSDAEFNAAYDENSKATVSGTPTATPPTTRTPQGFWNRLYHSLNALAGGEGPERKAQVSTDILHGVGRGAVGAVNNIERTIGEAYAFTARHTGIGAGPGYNEAYDKAGGARGFINADDFSIVSEDETNLAYGPKTDDPLATFAEAASQFISTGVMLGVGRYIMASPTTASFYASGALADAVGFDPYEAQLAELAARAPNWTGVGLLGKLLTVQGDDNFVVARLKRSAAGVVSNAILDGLISTARILRGGKVLANPASTASERTAARETVAQATETLQNVTDATHKAPNDVVTAQPTPDGQYTTTLDRRSNANMEAPAFQRRATDAGRKAPAVPSAEAPSGVGNGPVNPAIADLGKAAAEARQAEAAGRAANASPEEMARLVTAREQAEQALTDAQSAPAHDGPVIPSRGEAETQAAVVNDAAVNKLASDLPPDPQVQAAADLGKAATPADVQRIMDETHFDVSYFADPAKVAQHIDDIAQRWAEALGNVRGKVLPAEEVLAQANRAIGGLTPGEALGVFGQGKGAIPEQIRLLIGNKVLADMSERIGKFSDLLTSRPGDAVANDAARAALDQYYATLRQVAGLDSDVGQAVETLLGGETPNAKFVGQDTPATTPSGGEPAPSAEGTTPPPQKPANRDLNAQATRRQAQRDRFNQKPKVAGMVQRDLTPRNTAAEAKMVKLAQNPQDAFAVVQGATVIKNGGKLAAAFEVFSNALLSGPKTIQTVLSSGALVNHIEATVRMLAGAGTLNKGLMRSGADLMYGYWRYLGENLSTAWRSFAAGRSILNPMPQFHEIGGLTGDIIRIPSRVVGAGDEFTRVTAYRAYVRAASLRAGREAGLEGTALASRVDADLRAAYDPQTGVATLPEALRFAETPTFSAPLGAGTIGGDLQKFIVAHSSLRFLAPFQKASVNIFRYTFKSLPGVNLFFRDVREGLARGGEEAAIINARSTLAASLVGFATYGVLNDCITGKGPSNPGLRDLWLHDHKPYSFRATPQSEWHSYENLDPIRSVVGLMADGLSTYHELDRGNTDASDIAFGVTASVFSNLSAHAPTANLLSWADAMSNTQDPGAIPRFFSRLATSALVPAGVAALNTDPVQRDVQGFVDGVMARTPGLSKDLPPVFNMFGEPQLKAPGLVNRNQIFTSQPSRSGDVENVLLTLQKGFTPLPAKLFGGLINLKDRSTFDNGTGISPYERAMQLIATPKDGRPPFREALNKLVTSERWANSSSGSDLFPGGSRWLRVAGMKEGYEQRALLQVRREYPKLAQAMNLVRRARGAAIGRGATGVQQQIDRSTLDASAIESLFGTAR